MSAPADLAATRSDLDALLQATEDGASEPLAVADRVRALLGALPKSPWWIEAGAARRLLGIDSDATVAAWARLGLLASRRRPDGETEVLLADVLKRRIERDELTAVGGDEMTSEELRVLREERPGANPWERTSAPSRPHLPVWLEWIIAETWRVLTWQWLARAGSPEVADARGLTRAANGLMDRMLEVMTLVSLHDTADSPAWPQLRDENDVPIWRTAHSPRPGTS